jgi:subfamily B ATP-binding cassette protein MsbA
MAAKSKSKVTIGHVFKTIIWPRKAILLVGLILIIISRLASLVLPGASKYLMDNVIKDGDMEMLKIILIVVGASIIVQAITSFLLTKLLSVEAQRLIAILRSKVQKQILRLPIRFFDNNKSGALVSRIMSDVEGVRNLVGTGLVQLFGGILTAVISLILLINISPMMTLYVLVPVSVFGLISLKAFAFIRPIFRERRVINAEVTGRLTETLNGVRVIKGFNAEQQEVKTFEAGVDRLFQNVKKSLTSTSLVTSSATFLLGIASTGIMGIGGYMIINNQLTIGEFLSFTLYLGFMITPIIQMSNIGSQLTEAMAGLDRTEEIMNMNPEDDDTKRNEMLKNVRGEIIFDNVSFAYLAASFITADSGRITIDGIDISRVQLGSFRSNLGVVLQDDFLFEGTIRENILFPRPGATEDQLDNAVKAAHVKEFTDRLEDGLNTVIGERGVKLSGGQRQRVAIARAILADPKILILDEATSNLDTESETFIQASLKELMKGRTTFVIAHRLSTIRQANQILVIERGKIAEQGTHQELIDKEGRYYELYTYQARI